MVGEQTNKMYGESGAMEAADANHLAHEMAGPERQPSHMTERFLFLTGVASAAFGALLMVAPNAVPQIGEFGARLAAKGIGSVTLVMMGVGLFALGMVARTFTQSISRIGGQAGSQNSDSDFMLVADQLATDMAQALSTLHQVSADIAELSENNRTLLRNMPDANGQATANQTPIYRLAASVDQLCANVDTRLANLGLELNASMQGVTNSLSQVRGSLQSEPAQPAPVPQQTYAEAEPASAPVGAPEPQVAALPHPMDMNADAAAEQDSLELTEPEQKFENPALDIFDQMAETPSEEPHPSAPFGADQAIDPLDDLMPKYPSPPESDLGL